MNKSDITLIFKSPGEVKQKNLIKKLVEMGDGGNAMLKELWNETTSVEVRRWVVEAMGEFDNLESRKLIKSALIHPAMSVRLHAIRAIDKIGDRKLAEKILSLVDDESGGIRINVLDVIYSLRVKGYKDVIKKYLNDEKDYIKKRAKIYYDRISK